MTRHCGDARLHILESIDSHCDARKGTEMAPSHFCFSSHFFFLALRAQIKVVVIHFFFLKEPNNCATILSLTCLSDQSE